MKQPNRFMENTHKIIWTDEALENMADIIEYLAQRWTGEIRNFARLLDRQINLIRSNPELFPMSTTSVRLRKSILTKQTTIYYRIDDNEIRIVTLFENRQDPKKLKES
ncbi:MAG: type II toxin-antitoxin system RelE/ParE family toxin [Clostridia bacterium]|nr:type II toxin-antitoxin system RelE/ParE family toxin [Clostridia bacterium]